MTSKLGCENCSLGPTFAD